MILSVWYRVNSKKATNFRIWATNVLKSYLIKGYSINKNRLQEKWLKELENTMNLIKKCLKFLRFIESEKSRFFNLMILE